MNGRKPDFRPAEEGGRRRRYRHGARLRRRHAGPPRRQALPGQVTSSESAYDETHGCNYLLAIDIDMEPVPGYKAASWAKGYGDFVMKPDLADAPPHPMAGKDGAGHLRHPRPPHHDDLPHSPRAILQRQAARLEGARLYRPISPRSWSSICSSETYNSARAKHWQNLDTASPYIGDYHDRHHHQGRGRHAGLRNEHAMRRASRSRTPRANGAPARRRSTCATPRRWRWPTATSILKNGAKEIAAPGGQGDHLHGQVQLSAWPAIPATSTIRCGAPTARRRCSSTRRPSGR